MNRFLVLLSLVACTVAQVSFKADVRVYGDPKIPNAILTGKMNYFYNNTSVEAYNHNIRIDWNAPYNMIEQWIYHDAVHYRYCTACEAETYKLPAEQYYPLTSDVLIPGSMWNGCQEYTRPISTAVRQIWVHPTTRQVCKVAISGTSGQRTIEFSNVGAVENTVLKQYQSWTCPSPTCKRLLDLVLVFDDSGSINGTEWVSLINFGKAIVGRYRMAADATAIGIVFFGTSARIGSYLTIDQSAALLSLETTRTNGWTCIGCGIAVASDYVFKNIPSSKRIPGRQANPAKLMIVLTDGENNMPDRDRNNNPTANTRANYTNSIKNAKNANITIAAIGVDKYVEAEMKELASSIAGVQLLFTVSQFSQLNTILDKIIQQTCLDMPSSSCGTTCFGFCSCNSVCACPVCQQDTMCSKYSCVLKDGSTTGCTRTDVDCAPQDKCKFGTCDPALGCQIHDIDCDDGDLCTDDSCSNGDCKHLPKNCNDGKECTVDTCVPGVGCVNKVTCNDESVCTSDSCGDDGKCQFTHIECTDSNQCTDDICDPVQGCLYETKICPKDNFTCTEQHCDPRIGCLTTNVDCDDKDICTKDYCVEGFGCQYDEIDCTVCKAFFDQGGKCVSDNLCEDSMCVEVNGEATCVSSPKDCPSGANRCVNPYCDVATGECQYPPVQCEKKNCFVGKCVPETGECEYTPLDCSSNDACMVGSCDEATGVCVAETFCKSKNCKIVSCEASDDKKTATCIEKDFDCDSGSKCDIGTCDVKTGHCSWMDVTCSDELFCTDDKCDPELGCVFPIKTCDDGDPCTLDFCDEENDECYYEFACDDGLFCTDDWCGPSGECIHSPIKCNLKFAASEEKCFIQECIEENDRCEKRTKNTAVLDVCGNCLDVYANMSLLNDTNAKTACVGALTWPKFAAALTGAAVAGIIIAAIIGAIIIALTSFFGARELIKRSKSAQDQAAVNNPIYEASGKEMVNPAFAGDS